jgi:hypothetical protein
MARFLATQVEDCSMKIDSGGNATNHTDKYCTDNDLGDVAGHLLAT